eukprot:gene5557-4011_t
MLQPPEKITKNDCQAQSRRFPSSSFFWVHFFVGGAPALVLQYNQFSKRLNNYSEYSLFLAFIYLFF